MNDLGNFSVSKSRTGGFEVSKVQVRDKTLPTDFAGLRIVQLSDLHFGPATHSEEVAEAVEIARSLAPDIVVITGDFIQTEYVGLRRYFVQKLDPSLALWRERRRNVRAWSNELAELLAPLNPPEGIFGVFGNHDYIEGFGTIVRALRGKVTWLRNTAMHVTRGESSIGIVGIDDHYRGDPNLNEGVKVLESLGNIPQFNLLLSHNPDVSISEKSELLSNFNLVLCGHTHGGQVCIPLFGPILTRTKQRQHVSGLSLAKNTPFYVSRGVGYCGLRIRLFCPPEIVLFEYNA